MCSRPRTAEAVPDHNPERRDPAAAREIERELPIRYHREGDLAAREELVKQCLPLARGLAGRYTYTHEPSTTCSRWRASG